MRIAYICADMGIPVFGRKGSSIHIQEVIRALLGMNTEVELFAARFDGERPHGLEGVRIHRLPAPQKNSSCAAREQAAIAANRDLRYLLECNAPFDMVYERYSLWSFAGMEYARDMEIPGLLEVNAPLIEEQAKYRCLIDRDRAEQIAEKVFSAAGVLIAVSRKIAAYLESRRLERERVHVVPNAVNPQRFENIKPSCPAEAYTIGFVGTFKPWHGIPLLLEAYTLLHCIDPNIRLLVVGDGPERLRLVEDLKSRGLFETVCLTGSVDPDEIPGLLASMDVAVAPYPQQPDFYFSPLKVYEYMAAGLPVVASRVGQVAELIHSETNGLLFAPDDAVALASALDLLRSQPALRARLGQAARETVRRNHTWESVALQVLHLAGKDPVQKPDKIEAG